MRTSVTATQAPECALRSYTTVTTATYETVVPVTEINREADRNNMSRR